MQPGEMKMIVAMTGSIGVLSLVPQLRIWQGAICTQMEVIMSNAAQQFVSASAVRAAAGCPVRGTAIALDAGDTQPAHVRLAEWCDAFVVAPATANSIAALANGHADNLITLCALGLEKPRVLIPNMNNQMWRAPSVQRNLITLANDGWSVLGVESADPPLVAKVPPSLAAEELAAFIATAVGLSR